jgi:hypothetical protein
MNYELTKICESGYVSGKEMLEKADKLGITSGKEDADYLLAHQDQIPEEWRKYYLIFPKYLQDDDGYGHVAFFYWYGERWVLDFRWLGIDFSSDDRFVRHMTNNNQTWEERFEKLYEKHEIYDEPDFEEIKDFIRSTLQTQKLELLNKLEEELPKRIEDERKMCTPEEWEAMKHAYGAAETEKLFNSQRNGYNQYRQQVINLLNKHRDE